MTGIDTSTEDLNVFSDHAMIRVNENQVLAVVNVPASYKVSGFIFIKILSGIYCAAGTYYNAATGLFYDDEEFSTINGIAVSQSDSAGQTESTA